MGWQFIFACAKKRVNAKKRIHFESGFPFIPIGFSVLSWLFLMLNSFGFSCAEHGQISKGIRFIWKRDCIAKYTSKWTKKKRKKRGKQPNKHEKKCTGKEIIRAKIAVYCTSHVYRECKMEIKAYPQRRIYLYVWCIRELQAGFPTCTHN